MGIISQFSEKLKRLIEDSGTTIYQIAKQADLDRTTIQRSISGERLSNALFVEKLCDFLRVSPVDRIELMELYEISKIGEKTCEERKHVKKTLERV